MARWTVPEMSPWRRRSLAIPPDSWSAWVRLAVWELGMGALLYGALDFGSRLIASSDPRGNGACSNMERSTLKRSTTALARFRSQRTRKFSV